MKMRRNKRSKEEIYLKNKANAMRFHRYLKNGAHKILNKLLVDDVPVYYLKN